MEVLLNYPSEILNEIFGYLLKDDVKNLHNNQQLAPFYLKSKYHTKLLYSIFKRVTWPPIEHILTLPLFIETNTWFTPDVLEFKFQQELMQIPEQYLSRFSSINQNSFNFMTGEEYTKISHLRNLKVLMIDLKGYHFDLHFPENLRILHLKHLNTALPFLPKLRELKVEFGIVPEIPPNLKKLHLQNVSTKEDFPDSLIDLEYKFDKPMDLLYLHNLKILKIGLVDGFVLPQSLTALNCELNGEADLTYLTNLDDVFLKFGLAVLPKSVTKLVYNFCFIKDLTNLKELPLEMLGIYGCDCLSPEVLDVVYPSSLKKLHIWNTEIEDELAPIITQYMRFNHIPPNLELFDFNGFGPESHNILIDSTIVWPNTLRELRFTGIGGFFDPREQMNDFKCLHDVTWPCGLKSLTLTGIDLIVDSNLEELKLEHLGLERHVKYNANATPVPRLQIVHKSPFKLTANLKEVAFHSCNLELTEELFLQVPLLSRLELMACSIVVQQIVVIPNTVREIVIKACNISSEQLSLVVWPSELVTLNLTNNLLDLFDFSVITGQLKLIMFTGNRAIPKIPHWEEICNEVTVLKDPDWTFEKYVKLDDLGGAYTIERRRGEKQTIVVVVMSGKTVVYQEGTTTEVNI